MATAQQLLPSLLQSLSGMSMRGLFALHYVGWEHIEHITSPLSPHSQLRPADIRPDVRATPVANAAHVGGWANWTVSDVKSPVVGTGAATQSQGVSSRLALPLEWRVALF